LWYYSSTNRSISTMRQPLISNTQSSQRTAKYGRVAIFVIFLVGAMFVFSQQSSKVMEENAISEASEERMGTGGTPLATPSPTEKTPLTTPAVSQGKKSIGGGSTGGTPAPTKPVRRFKEPEESSVAMKEVPAPKDAPLIDPQALKIAEMGVPFAMLAYTWRNIPVDNEVDMGLEKEKPEKIQAAQEQARTWETEQVTAAKKWVPDFLTPPKLMSKDSIRDHRAYLSTGTMPDFMGGSDAPKRKAVIVGFPGTEGQGNDLWRDIQAKDSKLWKKVDNKEWNVATGFLTRYQEHMTERDFGAKMLEYVKQKKPEYIYIFGHSLGGAVASIAAADIVTSKNYNGYKVVLITFGQPRAFKQSCASEVNDFFKKGNKFGHEAWRFANYGDGVPSLPPSSFGFEHIGRPFYINKPVGGKWTLQEQAQDFTPYNIIGLSFNFKDSTSGLGSVSTHLMTEYRDRLQKIHELAEKEGVFSGKQMKQATMMERAGSFVPTGIKNMFGGKKKEQK